MKKPSGDTNQEQKGPFSNGRSPTNSKVTDFEWASAKDSQVLGRSRSRARRTRSRKASGRAWPSERRAWHRSSAWSTTSKWQRMKKSRPKDRSRFDDVRTTIDRTDNCLRRDVCGTSTTVTSFPHSVAIWHLLHPSVLRCLSFYSPWHLAARSKFNPGSPEVSYSQAIHHTLRKTGFIAWPSSTIDIYRTPATFLRWPFRVVIFKLLYSD